MRKFKTITKLFFISALFVACSEKPADVEEIILHQQETRLIVGDTYRLTADVLPANPGIIWISSDESVATVDGTGLVRALQEGEALISVSANGMSDECLVKVYPAPEVGDIYYSDGTYSSELDPDKVAVGMVFWTGDPTKDDVFLREEHPNCRHGLAMTLTDFEWLAWIRNWAEYYDACPQYGGTISMWLEANAPEHVSIYSGFGINEDFNKTVGYRNTLSVEHFASSSENKKWQTEVYARLKSIRDSIPAPKNSSGWYIPSIKELMLMSAGYIPDGISLTAINDSFSPTANIDLLNNSLQLYGFDSLIAYDYWSSSEGPDSYGASRQLYTLDLSTGTLRMKGMWTPDMDAHFRPILAF